jgi:mannosyltransferase
MAWTRDRRETACLTAMVALPVITIFLLSQGPVSYFWPRYLLFLMPALTMLGGAGLAAAGRRALSAVALAVFALATWPNQMAVRAVAAHDWWAMRYSAAAADIAGAYQPGDGIAYAGRSKLLVIDAGIAYHLPPRVHLRDVFGSQTAIEAGTLNTPEATSAESAALHGPTRIWVVNRGTVSDPYTGMEADKVQSLRQHYRLAQVIPEPGLTLSLLTRTN